MADQSLEDRVKRLEDLLDKIMNIARQHPMGKMLLNMLGE